MVKKGCVLHSFRHIFRDRLRQVDCQSEVIDQLGGWTCYGSGYKLETLLNYLVELEVSE